MDEKQVRKIAQEIFDEGLKDTMYSVGPVPYHTHNGVDSPPLDSTQGEWTYHNKLSWTAESTTKTISNLPLHDYYKLDCNISNVDTSNEFNVQMQLNGYSSADYNYITIRNTTLSQNATGGSFVISNGAGFGNQIGRVLGEIIISGKCVSALKTVVANIGAKIGTSQTLLRGELLVDTSDLSSITILPINAITGQIEAWWKDNK